MLKFILFSPEYLCLSGCLYPINVETAEPDRAQIFCGWSKFHILASSKTRFSLNFENPRGFFFKICELFLLLFYIQCVQRENLHNWNRRLKISVSRMHVKDYREFYQGYMSRIKEKCIRDTCHGLQRSVSGIHVKDYREVYQGYMSRITENYIRDTNLKIVRSNKK